MLKGKYKITYFGRNINKSESGGGAVVDDEDDHYQIGTSRFCAQPLPSQQQQSALFPLIVCVQEI